LTCDKHRETKAFEAQLATVDTPLTDLEEGRSTTRVDTPLADFRPAGFSINVYSNQGGFPVVPCGGHPAG
jgi:hypothetical protein